MEMAIYNLIPMLLGMTLVLFGMTGVLFAFGWGIYKDLKLIRQRLEKLPQERGGPPPGQSDTG